MFCGDILEKSTASSNNVSLFLSLHIPFPSEPEPQLGTLILSNITPDSFNVSWTTQAGLFAKIVINVSHAHSLHESQQVTVPGDVQQAHISGLVENTGYDVSVAGTTWAGDPTRPLTAFVITGIQRFSLVCLEFWHREKGKGDSYSKGKFDPNAVYTLNVNFHIFNYNRQIIVVYIYEMQSYISICVYVVDWLSWIN